MILFTVGDVVVSVRSAWLLACGCHCLVGPPIHRSSSSFRAIFFSPALLCMYWVELDTNSIVVIVRTHHRLEESPYLQNNVWN